MYTREDKIEIVEAFLSSALSVAAAARRPGWPCRSTLRLWVEEARRGELPISVPVPKGRASEHTPHKQYSAATRKRAVELYERGRRPVEIARLLGMNSSGCIRVWWKKARETGKIGGRTFTPKPPEGGEKESTVEQKAQGVDFLYTGEPVAECWKDLTPDQVENALLRAVLADLKAAGCDPASTSNRSKTELGERLRTATGLPLRSITDFLKISKSSYEYQRAAMRQPDKYAELRKRVKEVFWAERGTRGYRYVTMKLRQGDDPITVSEKVVRRIMREEHLIVVYAVPSCKKYSSYAGEISDAPENLVNRKFHAGLPNLLWLTDITEFRLPLGEKVYLSPVLDCFDGGLASWTIGRRPTAELANSSLRAACAQLDDGGRTVIHSDRGSHYRWPEWVSICEENGLVRSMSKKGCSPDNSAMEGFFGRLKNEFFYHRNWRGVTADGFMEMLDDWLRYYNTKRPKEALGWMAPMEYRMAKGLAS